MRFRFRLSGARLARLPRRLGRRSGKSSIRRSRPVHRDPSQRRDAILVYSGTFAERPLEAYDLYRDGYAPVIVLTREAPDGGQAALARREIPVTDRTDLVRNLLTRLGAPARATVTLNKPHDSTAAT